ncbi:hypothetical protein GF373_17370 [bacterium]|nr:hypothetical protein [bacterium]
MYEPSTSFEDRQSDVEIGDVSEGNTELEKEAEALIESGEFEEETDTKLVRLLRQVKYKTIGKSTGKEYVWNGAGSTVEVNSEDVDEILNVNNKKVGSCCGGKSGDTFEVIH